MSNLFQNTILFCVLSMYVNLRLSDDHLSRIHALICMSISYDYTEMIFLNAF